MAETLGVERTYIIGQQFKNKNKEFIDTPKDANDALKIYKNDYSIIKNIIQQA